MWGNKRADTIVTHKGSGESQGIDVEGVCDLDFESKCSHAVGWFFTEADSGGYWGMI